MSDDPGPFVFRTKLPDMAYRELNRSTPPPYCTRCDGFHGTEDCVGLEAEEPSPALAAVLLCRLVQLEAECDALRAQLAAFTVQNVRPPDEPEAPAFPFRALAPRRDDPRRLGHA